MLSWWKRAHTHTHTSGPLLNSLALRMPLLILMNMNEVLIGMLPIHAYISLCIGSRISFFLFVCLPPEENQSRCQILPCDIGMCNLPICSQQSLEQKSVAEDGVTPRSRTLCWLLSVIRYTDTVDKEYKACTALISKALLAPTLWHRGRWRDSIFITWEIKDLTVRSFHWYGYHHINGICLLSMKRLEQGFTSTLERQKEEREHCFCLHVRARLCIGGIVPCTATSQQGPGSNALFGATVG